MDKYTKTAIKILIHIKNNQNRNRPLTRSSIAKEINSPNCLVYDTSNSLQRKGLITYNIMNKRESKIQLTTTGEKEVSEIYLM